MGNGKYSSGIAMDREGHCFTTPLIGLGGGLVPGGGE